MDTTTKNNIRIYLSGLEMKHENLQKADFLKNSILLVEKTSGAKIGKKNLPISGFNMIKCDVEVIDNIEDSLWFIFSEFKKIKSSLIENLVQSITLLVQIKSGEVVDFALTKNLFSIAGKITVIIKVVIQVESNPEQVIRIELSQRDYEALRNFNLGTLKTDNFSIIDLLQLITVKPPHTPPLLDQGLSLLRKRKKTDK